MCCCTCYLFRQWLISHQVDISILMVGITFSNVLITSGRAYRPAHFLQAERGFSGLLNFIGFLSWFLWLGHLRTFRVVLKPLLSCPSCVIRHISSSLIIHHSVLSLDVKSPRTSILHKRGDKVFYSLEATTSFQCFYFELRTSKKTVPGWM